MGLRGCLLVMHAVVGRKPRGERAASKSRQPTPFRVLLLLFLPLLLLVWLTLFCVLLCAVLICTESLVVV